MAMQCGGEEEATKESSVSRLEAERYLRIHGSTDAEAKLKVRDGIPDGGGVGKIDDT